MSKVVVRAESVADREFRVNKIPSSMVAITVAESVVIFLAGRSPSLRSETAPEARVLSAESHLASEEYLVSLARTVIFPG